jgi:WD40 repeat protein
MAWSRDGEWLASTSRDGTLNLWSRLPKQTKPRFTRQSNLEPKPGLTSVAWSHDGQYLACGSTSGQLAIWETGGFRRIGHDERDARSTIHCLGWGVGPSPDDRRLAFGDDENVVHFRNYYDFTKPPDMERGIGHQWPILALAWSPDGSSVVTGTSGGTIGVWTPSRHDNELRKLLTWCGTKAHDGPVTTLEFCMATGVLASGGRDGRVVLWDVANLALLAELTVPREEEILDLEFGHQGEVIVVQTLHHIRVLRRDPLQEIAAFYHPASLTPAASTIAVSSASRLATIDQNDRSVISVWQVDFHSLLRRSELSSRSYRAAAVSLLGEPGSGRTNIGLTLAGGHFLPEHASHKFHVHLLRAADGADEIREVALWDLPTSVDHALVHRVHAGDGAVALMVLCPEPGTRARARKNLDRWSHTLRRWNTISRGQPQRSIVVVTKCDQLDDPDPDDAEAIAQALNVEKVVMTSAKTGVGIDALRQEIINSVNWPSATAFPSHDVLDLIVTFINDLRVEKRYLTTTRDLYDSFVRLHPYVKQHVPGEDVFRRGVQLLEVLGFVELFDKRDEVVLEPRYYHTYASAMIAGAERDEMGMGRLPLRQAEMGRGEQMLVEEAERLADSKQEERLLALTIHELVLCGVAQKVSTDGVSHLVFPISLTRMRDPSDSRPSQITAFQFVGETQDVFSSLIVRLLGLKNQYLKPDLWKNEAMFSTASGGCCGVVLQPTSAGDQADVSVHCDDQASKIERRQFLDMVREHIDTYGRIVSTDAQAEPSEVAVAADGPVEVFLCWKGSKASRTTAENVRVIAAQLRDKGIQTLGDILREVGDTPREHWARIERSRVALVLVAGSFSTEQELDYKRLEAAGCRMIPVVLPNAAKDYELPASLLQWESIDLRGRFLDTHSLADAVSRAWRKGPVRMKAHGRVFLSYSRTDSPQVDRLRQELERAGHTVWWDQGETELVPGTNWQDTIREAIRTSYAFIWCVSDSSMGQQQSWVYPEVSEAIMVQQLLHPSRIFIIPVRLSDCEIPEFRIDGMRTIRQLQWFDYFERRGNIAGLVRVLDLARDQANASMKPADAPPGLLHS